MYLPVLRSMHVCEKVSQTGEGEVIVYEVVLKGKDNSICAKDNVS